MSNPPTREELLELATKALLIAKLNGLDKLEKDGGWWGCTGETPERLATHWFTNYAFAKSGSYKHALELVGELP